MREAEIWEKLVNFIDASGKTIQEVRVHVGLRGMDVLNDLLLEGIVVWDRERDLYRRAR